MTGPVCVVAGVGPGIGAAIGRQFSEAGHGVALLARGSAFNERLASELANAAAFACDLADVDGVDRTCTAIEAGMGPVETLVFNAGKGPWGAIDQVDPRQFEQAWRTSTLGLFLCARRLTPGMKERGRGNIVVIGATASRRGIAGTAAYAAAKMGQRALTESMARHLGPSGIHVSLVIVDGPAGDEAPRDGRVERPEGGFISPAAIARTVLFLTRQDRSAWTFEIDLRPQGSKW